MEVDCIPIYYGDNFKSSVSFVQRQYIRALKEAGHNVTVIIPSHLEEYAKNFEANDIATFEAKEKRYPDVAHTNMLKLLGKRFDNKKAIYNFQSSTAIDLIAYLKDGRFRHPKIINHFIENYADYAKKDVKNYKRILGMITTPTLHNSEHTRNEWARMAMDLNLNGHVIMNQPFVNLGVRYKQIKEMERQEKHEVFTWIYPGNSLMAFKNYDKFLKVFDRLYASGRKFKVKMFLMDFFLYKIDATKYEWLELSPTLPQEEFWIEAGKCHAFLSCSKHETYGIAYWELISLGVLGVFDIANWWQVIATEDLLSGKSIVELVTVCNEVMDNYDDILLKQEKVWEKVMENHDMEIVNKQFISTFEELYNNQL